MLHYLPKPQPVGVRLAKLDDVPMKERQSALHRLLASGQINAAEAEALLDLIIDPGHHSTRIAA